MSRDPNDEWRSGRYEPNPFESANREHWDEDDWEEYLAGQDLLQAKYRELFETFPHHPHRDAIIAREMHLRLPDGLAGGDADLSPDDEPVDGPSERGDEDLGSECDGIPAYEIAQDYALAVENLLAHRLRDAMDDDEDACGAAAAACEVPARIAGGHGLGYDRESLCGNIACCKRALASLAECFDGLLALRRRRAVPSHELDRLLVRGQRVGDAIAQRIAALRRTIWWT